MTVAGFVFYGCGEWLWLGDAIRRWGAQRSIRLSSEGGWQICLGSGVENTVMPADRGGDADMPGARVGVQTCLGQGGHCRGQRCSPSNPAWVAVTVAVRGVFG